MKPVKPLKSVVNIAPNALIDPLVNKWVLEWCKKYHPEAVEEAQRFVKEYLAKMEAIERVRPRKGGI